MQKPENQKEYQYDQTYSASATLDFQGQIVISDIWMESDWEEMDEDERHSQIVKHIIEMATENIDITFELRED